jgi:hypothetical protein
MSTRLKIFLIIGAIIILTGLVWFFVFSHPQNPANNQIQNNNPSQGNGTQTLNISTPQGIVPVRDFTKQPVEAVAGTMALAETKDYQIIYFTQDRSFEITLLSRPIAQAQQLAESAFLNLLGVSQAGACKLNVRVSVPYRLDPAAAGGNQGLSFCIGQ